MAGFAWFCSRCCFVMSWKSGGSGRGGWDQQSQQCPGAVWKEREEERYKYKKDDDNRYEFKADTSTSSRVTGSYRPEQQQQQEPDRRQRTVGEEYWKDGSFDHANSTTAWSIRGDEWGTGWNCRGGYQAEEAEDTPVRLRVRSRSRSRSSPRYSRRRSRSPDYGSEDVRGSEDDEGSSSERESESVTPEEPVIRREAGGLLEFDAPCTVKGTDSFTNEEKEKLSRVSTWEEAEKRGILLSSVVKALEGSGASRPTPIQQHAMPLIAGGIDIVASAQTGTGKSLAFIAPIVSKVGKMSSTVLRPFFSGRMAQASPLCTVLAPTRELAMQLVKDFESCAVGLGGGSRCRVLAAYGGETASRQADRICAEQLDVLVATPGRLLEFNETGRVSLGYVKFLVLDEADQMLSMGLEAYVNNILTDTDLTDTNERQTLLFSATIDNPNLKPWLEGEVLAEGRLGVKSKLFQTLLRKQRVTLAVGRGRGSGGGDGAMRCNVAQSVRVLRSDQAKDGALWEDLANLDVVNGEQAIVFVSSRDRGKDLHKRICASGKLCCGLLQGKQLQTVREEVVRRFRANEDQVLVSTSVAARGLDFPNVTLVINYDMPESIETYTHRIGRTGRIGHQGRAIAYYNPASKDRRIGDALIAFLRKYNQPVSEELEAAVRPRRYATNRHYRGDGAGKGRSGSSPSTDRLSYGSSRYHSQNRAGSHRSRDRSEGSSYRSRYRPW